MLAGKCKRRGFRPCRDGVSRMCCPILGKISWCPPLDILRSPPYHPTRCICFDPPFSALHFLRQAPAPSHSRSRSSMARVAGRCRWSSSAPSTTSASSPTTPASSPSICPELMGRETWFHVRSDGYEVPKDGFGYRGVRLTPRPADGSGRIEDQQAMLAKRLGRLTGCRDLRREPEARRAPRLERERESSAATACRLPPTGANCSGPGATRTSRATRSGYST